MASKRRKSKLAGRWQRARNRPGFFRRVFRWFILLTVIAIALDSLYLWAIWPNWESVASGPIPKSNFIADYESDAANDRSLPPLRWHPVSMRTLPRSLIRAVVAAEDSRFYQHDGFDFSAFKEAMEINWERGDFIYGASTLSQQTAKNLFLSGSRNPLRKWHEIVLTYAMEQNLRKRRILEMYLNIAEFGPGVFGVDAAAQHYWGVGASELTDDQAVELAATLPAPKKHNPSTRTRFFLKHKQTVLRHLRW